MELTRGVAPDGLTLRVADTTPFEGMTHVRVERTGEVMPIERLTPKTVVLADRGEVPRLLIAGEKINPVLAFEVRRDV